MQNKKPSKLKTYAKDGILLLATATIAGVIGIQLPHWYKASQGPFKTGNFSMHVSAQPHRLTLYGTSTCTHCKSAREFLAQAGIPYNDFVIDKSDSAKAGYQKLGENAVPILVSENRMVIGFHREAYAKLAKSVEVK